VKTPDLTPVQMLAAVPALGATLDALGVIELDGRRRDALAEAVRFSSALVLADAVVRAGRSIGFGRHLDAVGEVPQFPDPVVGDDADEDMDAIALDDETGEPIAEGDPPLVPVGVEDA
jgi:hypothetical protein